MKFTSSEANSALACEVNYINSINILIIYTNGDAIYESDYILNLY